jgi:hypothetical protein
MTRLVAVALLSVVVKAQTTGGCNLCPDGSMPTNLDVSLFNPLFNYTVGIDLSNYTCATYREELLLIPADNDTCTIFNDYTGLAYVCGCTGAAKECSICPDGSPPTLPDAQIPNVGITCGELDPYFSFLGTELCQNVTDAELSTLCGCSSSTGATTIAPVIPGSSTTLAPAAAPIGGTVLPVTPGTTAAPLVAPVGGTLPPVAPTATTAPLAPVAPSATTAPLAPVAPVIIESGTGAPVAPVAPASVSVTGAPATTAPVVVDGGSVTGAPATSAPVGSVTMAPATAAPFAGSVAPATTLAPSMTVATEANGTLAPTASATTSKPSSKSGAGGSHALAVVAVAVMALLLL